VNLRGAGNAEPNDHTPKIWPLIGGWLFWLCVGLLSNLLSFRDGRGDDAAACTIRPATPDDFQAAFGLILSPPGASADQRAVQDFIGFARDRAIAFDGLHVATRGGKIVSAMLPVVSPGRTALILCPPGGLGKASDAATAQLIAPVCHHCAANHIELAQTLVDPQDETLQHVFTGEGFERMAELFYLQCPSPATPDTAPPPPPPGAHWITYSQETHDLFGRTILASYENSLDCPALNGRRNIHDIIAGHQASGSFDPQLWFLLREGDTALGVLLLSTSLRSDAIELVYLGLVPAARGRKLGELMMRHALATLAARKLPRLCLAVDSRNTPALKLYYRHGMHRLTSKVALLRDLRNPAGATTENRADFVGKVGG